MSRRRVQQGCPGTAPVSAVPTHPLTQGRVGLHWFLTSPLPQRNAARQLELGGPEPAGQVSEGEVEGWMGKQASFTSSSHLSCQVSTGHGLHLPKLCGGLYGSWLPPRHAQPHVPHHGSRRPALTGPPPCSTGSTDPAPQTFPAPRFRLWPAPEAQAVPGADGTVPVSLPVAGSAVGSCVTHHAPRAHCCLQMSLLLCSVPLQGRRPEPSCCVWTCNYVHSEQL